MKVIHLKPPYSRLGGHAFTFSLSAAPGVFGDSPEAPKASPAYLLEDGRVLGPAHAHHYIIRGDGAGSFSHWGRDLIFSTSDNTDPNDNGRIYELCLPTDQEIQHQKCLTIESSGADASFSYDVVRSALNTNGSAFALFLSSFRLYQQILSHCHVDIEGKTILEIGAGPNPGVSLAFLLHGAQKVYGNDLGPVNLEFPLKFALSIRFLARIAFAGKLSDLWDIIELSARCKDFAVIRKDLYEALPLLPAESIDLPDESVDLIFSSSVLEHVKDPKGVLANCFRILKPGGMCVHSVDLRDHSNPSKPLSFLTISNKEYASVGTENRWRASDFLNEFKSAGYTLDAAFFQDSLVPIAKDGNMDIMAHFMAGESFSEFKYSSLESVVPWVTESVRAGFISEYRSKTLEDLSVTGLIVVASKRK